jgi:HSP20 family molecular chaperone IbpA
MDTRVRQEPRTFKGLVQKGSPRLCQTGATVRSSRLTIRRPHVAQDKVLGIEVVEDQSEYRILVHLAGIDPRKVYVIATPRSLLIEVRFKTSVCHELANSLVRESIDRRSSRELILPIAIAQGGTRVQVRPDSLLITARKSEREQETPPWSQLLHFETEQM